MKRILCLGLVILAGATLFAQDQRTINPIPVDIPGKPVLCPYPFNQTLTFGPPTAPAPIASEFPATVQPAIAGSVWNQTAVNKAFGHTISFPGERQCCVMTSGRLEVKIKALQGGRVGSATSVNDAVNVYANGQNIAYQQPWLANGVATNTVTTVTFQLSAQQLASGRLSIYVQDDSAVQSIKLTVSGCCIRKP